MRYQSSSSAMRETMCAVWLVRRKKWLSQSRMTWVDPRWCQQAQHGRHSGKVFWLCLRGLGGWEWMAEVVCSSLRRMQVLETSIYFVRGQVSERVLMMGQPPRIVAEKPSMVMHR